MRFFTITAALCGILTTGYCDTTTTSARKSLPSDFMPPQVFKNLNLVRNTNLEKGYVRETTNVVIENIDHEPQDEYYLPFSSDLISHVGGLEVRDKKAETDVKFEVKAIEYDDESSTQYFVAQFPEPVSPSGQLTLSISYYLLSTVEPVPATIKQDDKQFLSYSFSAYIPTSYHTEKQKTKLKLPNSDVRGFTKTSGLTSGEDPEHQGSSLTYGPYDTADVTPGTEVPVTVRYEFTKPILTCSLLERDLEISHWGGNLATEERYWLRNDAADLADNFDRVSWTMKTYQGLPTAAVRELKVLLSPGSVDPYFIDDIGNVSTSRFRPGHRRDASLELKPRYPIFGGWKYSFKIGWNNELSTFLRRLSGDSFILRVPFLEGPKMAEGIQYEQIDTHITLPEGATNVQFEFVGGTGMPIPGMVDSELGLHKTFMDTLGRTVLKLSARNVADEAREGELIVTYEYPFLAGFRKPLSIFGAILTVFVTAWGIGQLDVSIKKR